MKKILKNFIKKFSILNFQLSTQKGFTLVELLVSVTIFMILLGVITLNLNTAQHNASIFTTVETLLTDLNQQQIKAMVGDTEGRSTADNYGIHFTTTNYTLFHGTYSGGESTNFSINLPEIQQITTTFPSSEVVFERGSGEIVGYSATQDTITVTDIFSKERKIIELNKFGVVTGVN